MEISATRINCEHYVDDYHLREATTTRSPERRNSRASAFPNPLVLPKSNYKVNIDCKTWVTIRNQLPMDATSKESNP